MIKGISKDAPIETNKNGGKQSTSQYAMHLLDPWFLMDFMREDTFISCIATFMNTEDKNALKNAFSVLGKYSKEEKILAISEVLKYGATRYKVNNWRLIPQEEHLNHCLIHYFAYLMGDTQDDHLEHCLCRLMFAYATEKSEKFSYSEFVE